MIEIIITTLIGFVVGYFTGFWVAWYKYKKYQLDKWYKV